ncbi:MAG TPA: cytochrome c [Aridibacter sp.]|nr:cytochrome c [Aridibacter sp.]
MHLLKISLCFVAAFLFIASCGGGSENAAVNNTSTESTPAPTAEAPKTPDELALGRSKYQEYCVKCHKEVGTGGEVVIEGKTLNPEDLTSEKMKGEPDEEYIEYMVKGIPDEGMPSFRDELSDEEMKAVVRYIREELQK